MKNLAKSPSQLDLDSKVYSSTNTRFETSGLDPAGAVQESIQLPSTARYYGIVCGMARILIASGTYCEFILSPEFSRVPNAPSRMMGLINMRGNLVPLYQLQELFGEAIDPEPKYGLLIGEVASGAVIVVNDKPEMFSRADAKPVRNAPPIPVFLAPSVIRLVEYEGEVWFEINHDDFFSRLAAPGLLDVAY